MTYGAAGAIKSPAIPANLVPVDGSPRIHRTHWILGAEWVLDHARRRSVIVEPGASAAVKRALTLGSPVT